MSAAIDLLASLVLPDGTRWGDAAYDWQLADATAILAPDGPAYHWISRPRGASKTTDLAAICLVSLLEVLPPSSRAYAAAADRDQARLLADAAAGFVRRTPQLQAAFRVDLYRIVATRSGSSLDVLASDGPSSWGLTPDLVVCDEVCQWQTTPGPRLFFESLSTAVAKLKTAKLVLATTSGAPSHWTRGIYEHAVGDPLWRVSDTPGPCPWIDEERLREQRARLPESSYRRLHLNEWVEAADRLVSPEDLQAATVLDGPLAPEPGRRYVLSLDLGLVRDRTVAAVAHLVDTPAPDGGIVKRLVLDRMRVWQGSSGSPVQLGEVEEWVELTARAYNRARCVFDVWQAVALAQRLRGRGVKVEEFVFSSSSVARLASVLHELLRTRRISLPDDAELLSELANVRLRETSTPGLIRLDHDPGQHDDRAIALALAALALLTNQGGGGIDRACYQCDPKHMITGPEGRPCYPGGVYTVTKGGITLTGEHHRDLKPGEGWGR